MFWGCFSGASSKGPGIFWEKEQGSIDEESYKQHTVLIIDRWIRLNRLNDINLDLMQDSAPGLSVAGT